jgi:hypothetical protein
MATVVELFKRGVERNQTFTKYVQRVTIYWELVEMQFEEICIRKRLVDYYRRPILRTLGHLRVTNLCLKRT